MAIASASSAKLAAGRSVIEQWHSPDQVALHTLFREDGPLDDRLADILKDADWILNFTGDAFSLTHNRLCDAAGGQVLSIDPNPRAETIAQRRHITQQWVDDMRQYGFDIGEPEPPVIRIGPHDNMHDAKADDKDRPRIIIHPGSGGKSKCWPVESFLELADSFASARITWIVGPVECDIHPEMVKVLQQRVRGSSEKQIYMLVTTQA